MSYYMGDFYRGDPGIGSFFFGGVKRLAGAIPVIGPAVRGALERFGAPAVKALPAAAGVTAAAGAVLGAAKGVIVKHPVLSAAGAAGALGAMGGAAVTSMVGGAGGCPKGYHISHSKHAKHFGQCVRNRRMNVCNPKALRRSIRRARGFTKLAMRTIHLVHPKQKGRFGGFRKKKRA